jgi:hypothetical protein
MPEPRELRVDSRGRLSLYVRFHSAEVTDFWIPRNHRTCDDHYNDHNNEFRIGLAIKLPALSLRLFAEKTKST